MKAKTGGAGGGRQSNDGLSKTQQKVRLSNLKGKIPKHLLSLGSNIK